jgi:hypothetical protein
MTRLPAGGATVASPALGQRELNHALAALRVDEVLGQAAASEIYFDLATLIGRCLSERERLEISPVAKALLSTAKNLSEASQLLGGLETGIHTDFDIAVTSLIADYLAIDPTVGSTARAQELISSFRQEADRIAHVCLVARADLPAGPGERGRRALDWYDDFTSLLLNIANEAGVEPTLRKDRITGARSGWLLEAAQALEPFLYPEMRSPSAEACGKRLERSLRRLRGGKRQKSRGR